MKFSLLYKSEYRGGAYGAVRDLLIPEIMSSICENENVRRYFIDVVSSPLTDIDEIEHRRGILRDIRNQKGLFDSLSTLFRRFDRTKSDWIELRSAHTLPETASASSRLDYLYSSLKTTAGFTKTLVSFICSICDTLDSFEIESDGLLRIQSYCASLKESGALSELEDISALFLYDTPETAQFRGGAIFDAALRIKEFELYSCEGEKKKPSLFSRDKSSGGEIKDEAFTAKLLGDTLFGVDSALTEIISGIFDLFFGISRELDFYAAAGKYLDFLNEKGCDFCYPELLPCQEDSFECAGIYDLYLAAGGEYSSIIPIDVSLKNQGLLIRGENNSGKTTLLRAIGTVQIFAQAGLPVPAKSCSLSVRNAVFSHFASAEVGQDAGRFEEEVKCIASILDGAKEHSLVLLNESFQTTAFDEGADAMHDILLTFSRLGMQYVFVSHLSKLFGNFDGCDVTCAEIDDTEKHIFKII